MQLKKENTFVKKIIPLRWYNVYYGQYMNNLYQQKGIISSSSVFSFFIF